MVDWDALGKILLVALLGGVGVTAIYGLGLTRLARIDDARGAGRRPAPADVGLVALAALVCVAAVVAGLLALLAK